METGSDDFGSDKDSIKEVACRPKDFAKLDVRGVKRHQERRRLEGEPIAMV